MTAPPLLFASALVGAVLGMALDVPWRGALVVLLILVAGVIALRRRPVASLLAILIPAALAFSLARGSIDVHDRLSQDLPDGIVVVEGVVDNLSPRRGGGHKLIVDVSGAIIDGSAEPWARRIRVSTFVDDTAGMIQPGDLIRARGRIKSFQENATRGTYNAKLAALEDDVHGRMSIVDAAGIAVMEKRHAFRPLGVLGHALRTKIHSLTNPHGAALVLALLVGDTSGFTDEDLVLYRDAGAGHLLAVSGLQVTLLAMIFMMLLEWLLTLVPALGRRSRTRWPATVGALVGVWSYTLLCGAPPSCVRAALMASATLVAVAMGRRVRVVDAVCLAGLATVLVTPVVVVDAGFLLSYAAVLGLAASTADRGHDDKLSPLVAVPLSALGAGLVTLPIQAALFGDVTPGGVLTNIVLVPAASALQVPAIALGLLGAVVDNAWLVGMGANAALVLEALTATMATLFGGTVRVDPPSVFSASVLVVLSLAAARELVNGRLRGVAATLAVAVVVVTAPAIFRASGTRVTFLPVGQGDSVLIEASSGHTILVDGGGEWDERHDPGLTVVVPALERRGIRRLDVMVLSHPDPDHLLGLLTVMDHVEVGALWHSGIGTHHPLVKRLLKKAQDLNIPVETARTLKRTETVGSVDVEILAPFPEDDTLVYDELTANDNSFVIRVTDGAHSVLLPGDIERWGERYLLRDDPILSSTVVKPPHHGSRTSSSPEFVDAVRAKHVVFTTGHDNAFGFPHDEVVARYRDTGACLWDTAKHGEITILLDDDDISIHPTIDAPASCALSGAP